MGNAVMIKIEKKIKIERELGDYVRQHFTKHILRCCLNPPLV